MIRPSYLVQASTLCKKYNGTEPLALWLKKYFKTQKQIGSRDRKIISALLFGYYRLGVQAELPMEQAMQVGVFLAAEFDTIFYEKNFELGVEQYDCSLQEKIEWLAAQKIILTQPNLPPLSQGLAPQAVLHDYMQPHHTFIRVRQDAKKILKLLDGTAHVVINEQVIGFDTQVDLTTTLATQAQQYVVQDASSTAVCSFFAKNKYKKIWDCCAASGGKSIAMHDANPKATLYASDVRYATLEQYKLRMQHYGIKNFFTFPHNAAAPAQWINNNEPHESMDAIICDVPCTGSGTWSRRPEQFYFWKNETIEQYTTRQLTILENSFPFLKKGGDLYYITCSAFYQENEAVIEAFLLKEKNALLLSKQLIAGTPHRADTLFCAVLSKS